MRMCGPIKSLSRVSNQTLIKVPNVQSLSTPLDAIEIKFALFALGLFGTIDYPCIGTSKEHIHFQVRSSCGTITLSRFYFLSTYGHRLDNPVHSLDQN